CAQFRGAAMDLRQGAYRALGSLRPSGEDARIRRGRVPNDLVVGRGARRQDRVAMTSTLGKGDRVTRRGVLAIAAGALASGFSTTGAIADEIETHGISSFGDLKYPADFKHLEYVNVDAPKGGLFSQIGPSRQFNQNFLTFNSLNSYILKGDGAQG